MNNQLEFFTIKHPYSVVSLLEKFVVKLFLFFSYLYLFDINLMILSLNYTALLRNVYRFVPSTQKLDLLTFYVCALLIYCQCAVPSVQITFVKYQFVVPTDVVDKKNIQRQLQIRIKKWLSKIFIYFIKLKLLLILNFKN